MARLSVRLGPIFARMLFCKDAKGAKNYYNGPYSIYPDFLNNFELFFLERYK